MPTDKAKAGDAPKRPKKPTPKAVYKDDPTNEFPPPEPGCMQFHRNGPERELLKELMARHGNNCQNLKPEDVWEEDEYFKQFKYNSIKSHMSAIKKELLPRGDTTGK
jgi:hypothetical protein